MFSGKKSDPKLESVRGPSPQKKTKDPKIPSYFVCPITLEMMDDPTITSCGHMFERDAIITWEANHSACPLCHKKIDESALAPCFPLKTAIAEFKKNASGSPPGNGKDGNVLSSLNSKLKNLMVSTGGKDKDPDSPQSPPLQTNSRRKEKDSNVSPPPMSPKQKREESSGKKKSSSKKGQLWARLVPLLHTYETLEIKVDEFTIGRSSHCDQQFNASEISNVHCMVYRVPRDSTAAEYDYFLEDKSTNGTYVNGNKVGKGLIASIVDGDEVSLGERFCSRLIPKLPAFIDWVFSGVELSPERKTDADKLKQLNSFMELLQMDDSALRKEGIRSEFVRSKITGATKGFLDKYRFPAFKLELAKEGSAAPSATPSAGQSYKGLPSHHAIVASNSSYNLRESSPRATHEVACEISFEPTTYTEKSSAGVVVMYLRRSKNTKGKTEVVVRSIDKGSGRVGVQYQQYEKKITFPDGAADANVEFYWKTDTFGPGMTTINFEVNAVNSKTEIGNGSEAMLIIETPNKHRSRDGAVASPAPQQPQQPFLVNPAREGKNRHSRQSVPLSSRNADDDQDAAESTAKKAHANQIDDNYEQEFDGGKNDRVKQRVDDELLAIMMDAFPSMDPHEILKVIKQERQMIAPLEDRHLLQDLVAIKLSNVMRGNANELEYSNIKMVKGSEHEEVPQDGYDSAPVQVAFQNFKSPNGINRVSQTVEPQMVKAPSQQIQPMNPDGTPKLRQTILRCELEGFLLMASISLIRKFFSIQGIECSTSHIPSNVVVVSVGLTESFMRTIDNLKPIESYGPPYDDVFEFDKIVDLFKKYVYSNGSELRSQAYPTDPKIAATGYRYDISFRKSNHHMKMENNHAIIEDMNTFARLPASVPQTSFYGVFDGHGGYLISEYLSLHLAYIIAKQPAFAKDIPLAIKNGFARADDLILKKVNRDRLKGGSTAVCAILRENVLHVAWAGDARCVVFRRIGSNLVAFPIVNPHNPQGSEKARVVKAGGFVEFIAGKWRVNGRLAVTRSFGDENLKPIVSAELEMAKFLLQGDEQFLMLSCDGLYDVMDYSDVAECLDNYLRKGMKLNEITAAMVQEGVTRASTDDITVMLVDLSRNPSLF